MEGEPCFGGRLGGVEEFNYMCWTVKCSFSGFIAEHETESFLARMFKFRLKETGLHRSGGVVGWLHTRLWSGKGWMEDRIYVGRHGTRGPETLSA